MSLKQFPGSKFILFELQMNLPIRRGGGVCSEFGFFDQAAINTLCAVGSMDLRHFGFNL